MKIDCSELSSGLYCRVNRLTPDVSKVQYNPEDSSEHHTRRRENLKSHMKIALLCNLNFTKVHVNLEMYVIH
jgi:hypothetical protein